MAEIIQDRELWEKEYHSGEWQFLDGPGEAIRNAILAEYVHWRPSAIHVLDLGCGSAAILRHLRLGDVSSYTGVDLAQKALDSVVVKRPQDEFVCSSLETFQPKIQFDVIIFNEILYYLKDPVAEVVRFERALKPNGHFVISMHKKKSWFAYNNKCIRALTKAFKQRRYTTLDAVDLTRLSNQSAWRIFALSLRG